MSSRFELLIIFLFLHFGCSKEDEIEFAPITEEQIINEIEEIQYQYNLYLTQKDNLKFPLAYDLGRLVETDKVNWMLGYFPGTLRYLYLFTNDDFFLNHYQSHMSELSKYREWDSHDVGIVFSSATGNVILEESFEEDIIAAADALLNRFNPLIGGIKCYDWNPAWEFPIIVDSLISLQILYHAYNLTGDLNYIEVAESHLNVILQNHYQDNYACLQVVNFTTDGVVNYSGNYQGLSDHSQWSRGQAWGLYGLTQYYKERQGNEAITFIRGIINHLISNNNLLEHPVPYWDYDASSQYDVSAATIMASAFLQLANEPSVEDQEFYFKVGGTILNSIQDHLNPNPAADNFFRLTGSVGNFPQQTGIDIPYIVAEYYYFEAIYYWTKYHEQNY